MPTLVISDLFCVVACDWGVLYCYACFRCSLTMVYPRYKHLERVYSSVAGSSLELRHKRSLYQSVLFVHLKIDHCYSENRYLAYRIASIYFENNTDVHMKMDMCSFVCCMSSWWLARPLPGHQQYTPLHNGSYSS